MAWHWPIPFNSERRLVMSDERLKRLIAKRDQAAKEREELVAQRQAIVDVAKEEAREDLSSEEDAEFRSLTDKIKDLDDGNEERGIVGLRPLDARISELSEEIERDAKVTEGAAAVRRAQARAASVTEARTYEKGNGRSYLQDLVRMQLNLDGNGESRERLQRHAHDVATDPEYRDLNRTDTTGGYFVPPVWLMSQWIELARAGRAYANLCSQQTLPAGTDSINFPKMSTGTTTAAQTADNAAVSETDLADDTVAVPVRTIAGQQDVAIQLLDQSPINFDEVIFRDLVADYGTKVDLQVISGTGLNGQVLGVRGTSNIITVTYTSATPTVALLYSKIADAVQQIHTNRYAAPTVIVMHPRRWAYLLAATDSSGRPLVTPDAGAPQNVIARLGAVGAEMVVGQMHGLPVVTDPNLPINLGAGTNQDVVHVIKANDLYLYESSVRTRVLPDVGSGTLTTRLQVYGYVAFTAARYPKSVAEIGGTGLVTPTF